MSSIYDNWERLVAATLDRVKLRELALAPSRETSFSSSIADDFDFSYNLGIKFALDDNPEGHYFTKSILAVDRVIEVADGAAYYKQECLELKSQAEKIALLLRAGVDGHKLYKHPAARIIYHLEHVLNKVLALVLRCRVDGLKKHPFFIIPTSSFRKLLSQLKDSIGNVNWLLRLSSPAFDGEKKPLGRPPLAASESIRCLIWELIADMDTGSVDEQADAVEDVISLAQDYDYNAKLVVEEGGVGPLLKLLMEGKWNVQENAAMAIGLLGKDPESVEHMIHAGVCFVFAKILREGPMKVQGVVAWAISELAAHYPRSHKLLAQCDIVELLVNLVDIEMDQIPREHNNNINLVEIDMDQIPIVNLEEIEMDQIPGEHTNFVTVGKAKSADTTSELRDSSKSDAGCDDSLRDINDFVNEYSLSPCEANGAWEMENPATLAYVMAMACRALWQLAKGNSIICQSIAEFRALSRFLVLLEKGPGEVQYNCAMVLVEITAMAEKDDELRGSAFNPNSSSFHAMVDQLCRVIQEKANSELLVPCIKTIGNLAPDIKATDTRMISPLVNLLEQDYREACVEACVALIKFASPQNVCCLDWSKAIIDAGGVRNLHVLMYCGMQIMQRHALILLCYIVMHVPNSEELARCRVTTVLNWASNQPSLIQNLDIEELLNHVKYTIKLHQHRGYIKISLK